MPDAQKVYYALFLEKFNNYFNRIVKTFPAVEDYETAVGEGNYFLYSKTINYNPHDSVSTELIMNDCPFEADYVLILDKDEEIVSRWFVMETIFTRNGQKLYKLRRDLISDFKDKLMDSPMFVEKAHLNDDDPFIVNDEGMSLNQVKTSETLLKDRTNSAWIVGYISKSAASVDETVQVADEDFDYLTISDLASACGINEPDLASILNFDGLNENPAYFTSRVDFRYAPYYDALPQLAGGTRVTDLYMKADLSSLLEANEVLNYNWQDTLWTVPLTNAPVWTNRVFSYFSAAITANKAAILAQFPTIFNRKYFTDIQLNKLYAYQGRIIRYNGVYYKLSLVDKGSKTETFGPYTRNTYTSIKTAVDNASTAMNISPSNTGHIFLKPQSKEIYVQMETISYESGLIPSVQAKVSSSRLVVENQAFDMFCIPYGAAKYISDLGNQEAVADYALSIGSAIAVKLDAALYDLQLLPYCPLIDKFDSDGVIDLTAMTENVEFNYIDKTDAKIRKEAPATSQVIGEDPDNPGLYQLSAYLTIPNTDPSDILDYGYIITGDSETISSISKVKSAVGTSTVLSILGWAQDPDANVQVYFWYKISGTEHASFILWARRATFSTQLNYNLTLTDSMKIESQCNFYRLVSPNYQGSFEFNLAKNGGNADFFLAECTYKPYTPYIKIVPQLNFLYGSNFGDNRGLICGGDFSLPRFTSAWENYLLNNKNYQNIFNRDIQNLNLEQKLERNQQAITGALGVAGAGVVGGVAGAQVGGIYGAIAGAVIGTAGSVAGFGYDMDVLMQRQREARQLSIDKYNYQLGNIKALPYTLTKVGAFDINSKIWPFLEFYTCTEAEKEALESKIRYESMTVMRIDIIGRYMDAFTEKHYLKGQLIRNEEIAEDNHVFEALYAEFAKGVYC